MSIDIISKDILLKAQLEKEKINLNLSKEISELEENFEKNFDDFKSIYKNSFYLELASQKNNILSSSKTKSKKIILEKKSFIIEKVIENSIEKLNKLLKVDRENLLIKIIDKVNLINISYDTVYCDRLDFNFLKKTLDLNINIIININLFSLIFENTKNKTLVNLSFEQMIRDIFEENEYEVLEILF